MDTSEAETDGKEYPCLIRVTNGKDINLSTHVSNSCLLLTLVLHSNFRR